MPRFYLILIILTACKLLLGQNCPYSEYRDSLEGQNLLAFHSIGSLWLDSNKDNAYIYPKQSGISALSVGSFWVAGKDVAGKLKVSAKYDEQYRFRNNPNILSISTPWRPGPNNDVTSCEHWNQHFSINGEDVSAFKDDLSDGVINNNIPTSVLGWPGNGNPYFESVHGFEMPISSYGFAPFTDADQDGIYDPSQGDLPIIHDAYSSKWWSMNDFSNDANPDPLKIELQIQACSYDGTSEALNNSIIYIVKIINRSGEMISDMAFSFWIDHQLGCGDYYFFGSKPDENLVYMYSGYEKDSCNYPWSTGYQENIPLVGFKLLEGLNSIGEEEALHSVIYTTRSDFSPLVCLRPNTAEQFYDRMHARWSDGTQMTFGRNGVYNSNGQEAKFVFPDDPNDKDGWSLCTADLPWDKREILINFGDFELKANESKTVAFSITGVENVPHPCPDISPLIERTSIVKDFWKKQVLSDTDNVMPQENNYVNIFPNPGSSFINIESSAPNLISIVYILNINGKVIREYHPKMKNKFELNIEDFRSGIYFTKIELSNGHAQTKKLIIH